MRLRRDSLLIKIIFYNDIAIILTSLMIAGILTFITFKDMDSETKRMTREKIKTLDRFYDFYVNSLEDDIYQMSNGGHLSSTTAKQTGEMNYSLLAARIKSQMDKQNFKMYRNTVITLIGYKGEILGESGRKDALETLTVTNSHKYLEFLSDRKYQIKSVYQEAVGNSTVVRISVPNYLDKNIREVVMSFTIEDTFLKRAREILGLDEKHRIFYIQASEIVGEEEERTEHFDTLTLNYDTFNREQDYLYREVNIEKEIYYLGIYPLEDAEGKIIGSLGIAISKTDVTQMKALVLLMIASITIALILFNSAIFGKIFYKMLNPLVEVAEASNRIARGESGISLKVQGSGEIRSMVKSFKKMVETIEENEKDLKEKNLKLKENINRIDVIEKLLLGIYGEEDIFDVIRIILRALTSEVGLGYSRGVFLRYSREIESLVGEYSMVNNSLKNGESDDQAIGTFRFQRESLDEIISYIKISIREKSLLAESLLEKKIIYYNDKSYKYNLGNELLQSMGFNNFIIIPIYSNDRDYGCIILDNFMKKREITPEEVELLNLLILNLGTHFKNKSLEEEKLENERALTIGKLSEKFLDGREMVLSKIYHLMEEAKAGGEDIAQKLIALEGELINIKREDSILTEYSDMKEYQLEVFPLNELLNEIYLENKEEISSKGISISLFVKYNGMVYGDRRELKKVFLEVLDNAIDAVAMNGKANKKINIILSKGRNTEKIRVRVVDNGIGMDETELQNIGEPFVSYKKDSAGLGLSIAFRIIKHHRGIMKFISTPNEGTEVKITLNDYKEENK
ncbi:sensor histidine kinase [Propionigenium maris DSM 9537]|uniref:Signal transduction histidine-protein kinase/phosphatase MprB n=1 Tax=Propionigenium maris DSM 9537 TaxID=1123000 RepID=A0A9W6GL07_9FUSO|nr:ATP-binding protein [Propionigenium maris]GLI55799.1 sensor histidine kinase [Propionigenium maris DSM 9537]